MRQILLTQDKIALVDDIDYERAASYPWRVLEKSHGRFYAITTVQRKTITMHSLILGARKEFEIDHINHDGLDNRRVNLRWSTSSQNKQNMRKHKGSSRYKGVSLIKSSGRWRATICYQYRDIHIGIFKSEEAAAQAYNEKAIELFGEFAHLNKIGG